MSVPTSTSRGLRAFAGGIASIALVAIAASCSVNLGDLPARCTSGSDAAAAACPQGYECIHDVCARPGTPIPITLTTLQYLRPFDLRIVPQGNDVLAVWQVYHYDLQLHDFAGARIMPDGNASAPMLLVTKYPANADYLEPYFDVLGMSDTELLMSMGAAPADDAPEPRLTQFAVHLPPVGSEAKGATFDQRWEKRLRTIGYGAVSQPKLEKTSQGISLAYFENFTTMTDTVGALDSYEIANDGSTVNPPACTDSSCCQANDCFTSRPNLPVAVSVWDGFVRDANVWWIVDDTRPSFVRQTLGAKSTFADGDLPRLAVPVDATADTLVYLQPSARGGTGLPDDPVVGAASLQSVTLDAMGKPGAPHTIGALPGVRDTPRPAWVSRAGKPALLVTPGTDETAPELSVYAVDTSSAAATKVASIKRYSSIPVSAVRAAIVQGKLYVVWLDASPDAATVRAAVIPEP